MSTILLKIYYKKVLTFTLPYGNILIGKVEKTMNRLSEDRQVQIIKVLYEGNSIRSTARITNTAINTVVKLLKDVGAACLEYQYQNMRNLHCKTLQCDEI